MAVPVGRVGQLRYEQVCATARVSILGEKILGICRFGGTEREAGLLELYCHFRSLDTGITELTACSMEFHQI